MDLLTIIFIAIGLAMDAFAVSVANGLIIKKKKFFNAFKFGFSFGLFQMIMPLIGWSISFKFRHIIEGVDHWIAFILLSLIGSKMIYGAFKIDALEREGETVTAKVLLVLSIATSIDALAVGVSFAFLNISIMLPAIIIGIITFLMSFFGFLIGSRFGHVFENKIEIIGGIILIGIGFKILIEHLLN